MSITVGRAAVHPRLWGHVFDSRATRENSSKHTNLCFLPPSAREGRGLRKRLPRPGEHRAGEGRTDLAAMLKEESSLT